MFFLEIRYCAPIFKMISVETKLHIPEELLEVQNIHIEHSIISIVHFEFLFQIIIPQIT